MGSKLYGAIVLLNALKRYGREKVASCFVYEQLLQWIKQAHKENKMKVECPTCEGEGEYINTCNQCCGSGEGMWDGASCWKCRGKGELMYECEDCDGTGEIEAELP